MEPFATHIKDSHGVKLLCKLVIRNVTRYVDGPGSESM